MRNDFAVFILSHGRAESITTINELLRSGYTGKWFVIIDNLDSDYEKYLNTYKDHVIVFDKEKVAENVDTVTAHKELKSPVYARNACYDIASDLRLKYFAEFDDDLSSFYIRYEEDGKLKAKKILEIDYVFDALIEFQEASGAYSVGIDSANGLVGGLNGKFKEGIPRGLYQSFILRTDKRIEFKGILNEDDIALNLCNMVGKLTFQVVALNQSSPMRSTNEGGNHELYKDNSEYIRALYSVITCPSSMKIFPRNGHITLKRTVNLAFPKIINERWKK